MYFVLRTETFAKLFFLISCTGLLMYATLAFYTFHTAHSSISQLQKYAENVPVPDHEVKFDNYNNVKYILLWAFDDAYAGEGHAPFIEQNCSYTNCYLTRNKNLQEANSKFAAIIFDVNFLLSRRKYNFTAERSSEQIYIFHSKISSDDAPVCSVSADHFFNWTWSYRLDSDIFAPFFEVRDSGGDVIAPRPAVKWLTNTEALDFKRVDKLKHKKKAVAWIVSKCITRNDRMLIAKGLQKVFRDNGLDFDIFGCGNRPCPAEGCLEALERDYFFYYAPEDSHATDYVTGEVLLAYSHYAVPIVTGGADYRKFIPDGSYINMESYAARDRLAAIVEYILRNPKTYQSFHRWRNHYTISETHKFKGLCKICKNMNDDKIVESVKENFRTWWFHRPLQYRCVPKGAEAFSELLSYINESKQHWNKKHFSS